MMQLRSRRSLVLSFLVLASLALFGCEAVRRYADARKNMSASASILINGGTYADSYALERAIHTLGDYSTALSNATQYSGEILDHLDKATVDERTQLRELFNLNDWATLEVEMLQVAHAERGIADQCESQRFRDEPSCGTYQTELKGPLSRNRESLTFRYAQILKRI